MCFDTPHFAAGMSDHCSLEYVATLSERLATAVAAKGTGFPSKAEKECYYHLIR